MRHLAHMQTLLPLLSCRLPLFSERVLVQNVSHENDLILLRINIQVTYIFIGIVSHKYPCSATAAKVAYSFMSWLREPLIEVSLFILDDMIFVLRW